MTHATATSPDGPYTKRATAVQHEAHNPEVIKVGSYWYIFHIGSGASTTPVKDCNNSGGGGRGGRQAAPPPPPPPGSGSPLHRASSPEGPFLPIESEGYGSCNNPSPFVHPNGTLFLVCTWSIRSA